MSDDADVLLRTRHLPARERAAALAHWIYVKASQQEKDWSMRVADAWESLDRKAREFNLASIDVWLRSPEVLAAWIEALSESGRERAD